MIFNCWHQVLRNLCPPGANSQSHPYLSRLRVSQSRSGMPASSSTLVSIGCLCLVPRVPPNLVSNHSRAYPSHIPSSLPPHNKWCRFAHVQLLFHKLGMFLLKSLEQFPLPKAACTIPGPFQILPLGKSQLLLRLLQEASPHALQPMSAFL